MAKQTIFLFIRALIIGILLNIGVQQVSEIPTPRQETSIQQQMQPASVSHSPADAKIHLSDAPSK
jgi:hypothetical protein